MNNQKQYNQSPSLKGSGKKLFVRRANEKPTNIRHFRQLRRLYQFIDRNPAMFRNATLEICLSQTLKTLPNNVTTIARYKYEDIQQFVSKQLDEKTLRQEIKKAFDPERQ